MYALDWVNMKEIENDIWTIKRDNIEKILLVCWIYIITFCYIQFWLKKYTEFTEKVLLGK